MGAVPLFVKPTDDRQIENGSLKMSGFFYLFFIVPYGIFETVQTGIFFR